MVHARDSRPLGPLTSGQQGRGFRDSGDQSGISPRQAPPLSWGIQAASQERVMELGREAWAEGVSRARDERCSGLQMTQGIQEGGHREVTRGQAAEVRGK